MSYSDENGFPRDDPGLDDDLAAFDDIVSSAYAEEAVVYGSPGDPNLVPAAAAPSRPASDLGVGGSLRQTRQRLRVERRANLGPIMSDLRTIVPAVLVVVAGAYGSLIVADLAPGNPWIAVPLVLLVVALAATWLVLRRGWPASERTLFRTMIVEQVTATHLQRAFQGTSWVVLHDRVLPGTEHRVPFLAVGPAGIAVLTLLPPGPYLASPTGLVAGEEQLSAGWLPTRAWEARWLLEAVARTPARDLVFRGPVFPLGIIAYPKRRRTLPGWSALAPLHFGGLQLRNAPAAGQFLRSLPSPLGRTHVVALVDLVDRLCPPAPTV